MKRQLAQIYHHIAYTETRIEALIPPWYSPRCKRHEQLNQYFDYINNHPVPYCKAFCGFCG